MTVAPPQVSALTTSQTSDRPLVVAGFMGTGKSTLGKLVAKKLGYRFIDTDTWVERQSGRRISEIFAEQGEAAFRAWEKKALAEALAQPKTVIAVGGGALCSEANFAKIQTQAIAVVLTATVPTLLQRLKKDRSRPLLQKHDPESEIHRLLAQRKTFYQRVAWQQSTDQASLEALAEAVAQRYFLESNTLRVSLGDRSYPLYFPKDKKASLSSILENFAPDGRLLVLSNPTVLKHYEPWLKRQVGRSFELATVVIPDGERFKNLKTVEGIYREMVRHRADRRTPLLALGGGVIGDVGGFVAATYLRGIPFLQVPTTLLAQVDSSIGGKTGVDLPEGKNLVGAFYQPKGVWIDENFLTTLSPRELICGMAEVIKYAAIFDADLFEHLEDNVEKFLKRGGRGLAPVIRRCCEWKAWVVEHDEKETLGLRAKLNFGHTLGHAIESLTRYRRYTHGEAIAMGMMFAAERSMEVADLSRVGVQRLQSLLERAGLPTRWPKFSPERYQGVLAQDKKRVSKDIHFVYLKNIGASAVQSTNLQSLSEKTAVKIT